MAIIAMTREMATLGRDVAAGLAERLGLDIVHHELVAQDIAERAGMRESEVQRFLGGEASLLDRWRVDSARVSRYTAEEILELAVKGNVLIRGWGATYLLRNVPHVVCVRICAPMADRERVLMQRLGIHDPATARREIERNDAAHNGTMQRLFGIDWTDPALYALVLNTARIQVADCVEHIVKVAESPTFQETAEFAHGAKRPADPVESALRTRSAVRQLHHGPRHRRGGRGRKGPTQGRSQRRAHNRRDRAAHAHHTGGPGRREPHRPHRICARLVDWRRILSSEPSRRGATL